jgi:hypothetical protein
MGKQGDEFEPAPGIRGWWITYADIFLYDGDNRNLMLFEMDSTTRCWGFSAEELAKQFGMDVGLLLLNNQIGALTVHVENMQACAAYLRDTHAQPRASDRQYWASYWQDWIRALSARQSQNLTHWSVLTGRVHPTYQPRGKTIPRAEERP